MIKLKALWRLLWSDHFIVATNEAPTEEWTYTCRLDENNHKDLINLFNNDTTN